MPTVEKAKEILGKFLKEKGDGKFKELIEKFVSGIQKDPALEIKEAGLRDVLQNMRGLADPKILMAMMVLFMSAGTTQAGPLMDMLKGHQQEQTQTQESWQSIFNKQYKDANGGFIKYQGKDYRVGRGVSRDEQMAVDKAEMNARSFDAKSGESKTLTGTKIVKTVAKTLPNGSIEALVLMETGQ
jgi:hypothetical protein